MDGGVYRPRKGRTYGEEGPAVMTSYGEEDPAMMGKGSVWIQAPARVGTEVDIAEGHKSTEVAGNWARVLCA
ncbi:hypothetical protein PS2_028524 [Malus domestica]